MGIGSQAGNKIFDSLFATQFAWPIEIRFAMFKATLQIGRHHRFGHPGRCNVHFVLAVVIGSLVAIVLLLSDIARTLDAIKQNDPAGPSNPVAK